MEHRVQTDFNSSMKPQRKFSKNTAYSMRGIQQYN